VVRTAVFHLISGNLPSKPPSHFRLTVDTAWQMLMKAKIVGQTMDVTEPHRLGSTICSGKVRLQTLPWRHLRCETHQTHCAGVFCFVGPEFGR